MNLFTRRTVWAGGAAIVILMATFFLLRYRTFVLARAWHFSHGNRVRFGAHEIDLPRSWWVTETDRRGDITILFESRSTTFVAPEIGLHLAYPGEVAESDIKQSQMADTILSLRNGHPQPGWAYSSPTLAAKSAKLYCNKEDLITPGAYPLTILTCYAAGVPYSFHYKGSSAQVAEAESIFKTLR